MAVCASPVISTSSLFCGSDLFAVAGASTPDALVPAAGPSVAAGASVSIGSSPAGNGSPEVGKPGCQQVCMKLRDYSGLWYSSIYRGATREATAASCWGGMLLYSRAGVQAENRTHAYLQRLRHRFKMGYLELATEYISISLSPVTQSGMPALVWQALQLCPSCRLYCQHICSTVHLTHLPFHTAFSECPQSSRRPLCEES